MILRSTDRKKNKVKRCFSHVKSKRFPGAGASGENKDDGGAEMSTPLLSAFTTRAADLALGDGLGLRSGCGLNPCSLMGTLAFPSIQHINIVILSVQTNVCLAHSLLVSVETAMSRFELLKNENILNLEEPQSPSDRFA